MRQFLEQLTNGLAVGSIYALIALGYTMVYGVLKLINFAHGDLFTYGAYLGMTLLTSLLLQDRLGLGLGLAVVGLGWLRRLRRLRLRLRRLSLHLAVEPVLRPLPLGPVLRLRGLRWLRWLRLRRLLLTGGCKTRNEIGPFPRRALFHYGTSRPSLR